MKFIKRLINYIKNLFRKKSNAENTSSINNEEIENNSNVVQYSSYDNYKQVKSGNTQAWYGRVNYWNRDRDLLIKELEAFVRHGVRGYMIEMAGWNNSTGDMWTDKWISKIESDYKWLLGECRKRKIWVFVSIVNDNMGKNKYGDKGPTLSKVYDKAEKLAKIIESCGSQGVYVQPVAETQTEAGKKFEKYCISKLSKFNLVYNGNGGHPSSVISGMKFYATHPGHISDGGPSNSFVISDHGLIIRELNKDGKIDSFGDPSKVKTWANIVKNGKSPVCGYYAFLIKDFDNDTIKAIGNALK